MIEDNEKKLAKEKQEKNPMATITEENIAAQKNELDILNLRIKVFTLESEYYSINREIVNIKYDAQDTVKFVHDFEERFGPDSDLIPTAEQQAKYDKAKKNVDTLLKNITTKERNKKQLQDDIKMLKIDIANIKRGGNDTKFREQEVPVHLLKVQNPKLIEKYKQDKRKLLEQLPMKNEVVKNVTEKFMQEIPDDLTKKFVDEYKESKESSEPTKLMSKIMEDYKASFLIPIRKEVKNQLMLAGAENVSNDHALSIARSIIEDIVQKKMNNYQLDPLKLTNIKNDIENIKPPEEKKEEEKKNKKKNVGKPNALKIEETEVLKTDDEAAQEALDVLSQAGLA